MDALEALRIESAQEAQSARAAASDETGQTDFLQMLVAQLENQDPLNPQDSAQFAAQLAQFSTVEQLIAVREGVEALVSRADSGLDGEGSSMGRIDPTNLVGQDVVVFGSQIEVDSAGSSIEIPFRIVDPATRMDVDILNADGDVIDTVTALPIDPDSGGLSPLDVGDHTFRYDPAARGLGAGVYGVAFRGRNVGEEIAVLPMVEGRVTGAILAGEPSIRIGGRVFPIADVLEVKLAGAGG